MRENFKNKRVLITGHTGFKGSWLTLWLNYMGAKILGISYGEISNPVRILEIWAMSLRAT